MGGQAVAAVAAAVVVVVVAVAAVLAFVKKVNDTSCLVLLSLQNFHSIIHVKERRRKRHLFRQKSQAQSVARFWK